ncbi:MAG: hypothetical protein H6713_33525 [Myxococcales bacterium]|nr:hypothetical protein [Myxococcales bacterium]
MHGAYWLPRRHELASLGQPGASVLLSLGTIRARGCGVPGGARVEVPMCLALELGGMRGVGSGLPINGAFTGLWSAVVASPGLLVRLSTRVALSLRADAALAITRPTFTVAPLGAVYQAPRASLALALGLELRLGPSR